MKTAVVILNWNGIELLKKFLPSVTENSPQADIYIVDNASTDDSVIFVKSNFPEVKIIQNSENLGYAGGYNEGLKSIDADIYCLLNSDVEVTKNWLSAFENIFKNPEIAAAQPKILDFNHKNKFEYAGAAGGFLDNFGYPYCRGRVFWTLEEDQGQYDDEIEIFWASGACLFIRSKDFWEMQGFENAFFAHMEEIDLCWRLRNKGKKVYYSSKSTVYHLGGATLHNSPQKTYLNFRNSLWMLLRNLPAYKLFPVIFTRLVLDGITAIVFWRYHGFGHLVAIFNSHMSFYSRARHFFNQRNGTTKDFWKHRFVPWQYFILGRKKIDELK
ncbi:MAG: glycosyltransferase family 2 protein [Flavobacteriaceae bacterium]|nr:glycosyltransferase family 2 protein [Flavobacteriaceae bacterium]